MKGEQGRNEKDERREKKKSVGEEKPGEKTERMTQSRSKELKNMGNSQGGVDG